MSPRRRTIDNPVIIAHACELLVEQGRDAVTFAQVAQRSGLAPATLVQRFASRDGMLTEVAAALFLQVAPAFALPGASAIDRLKAGTRQLAPVIGAALALPASRGMGQFSLELRKQISFALLAAVEAGELPRCDVAELARTIQISVVGSVATARLEGGDVAMEVTNAVEKQLANFV